ncbi:13838_t:CDS:2 [Racocetra persica]|uniref:13838_t:CDS:1 n=1 Tax=Racocetra persica TaxID=160502 RepID=A0ACA9KRF3_9GLOM|nr:13838_t:CDS:2 [Racocetra persica]
MLLPKYFVISILLNLIFENLAKADEMHPDLYESDAAGFLSVIIIQMTCIFLSVIGILYVFSRIYHRWMYTRKSLPMSLRIPFYLGIFDVLIMGFEIPVAIYVATYRTTLPEITCRGIVFAAGAFTIFHRTFVASVSVVTYLRVCWNKHVDTGRYDWKLLLPISIPSIVMFALGWDALVLFICLFCYLKIIFTIHVVKKQQSTISNYTVNKKITTLNEIEIKVIKKILGYVLVFILQWFPTVPYELWQLHGEPPTWSYCMVAVGLNMGGIGNAIFYVINEGWNCNAIKNEISSGKSTDDIESNSDDESGHIRISPSVLIDNQDIKNSKNSKIQNYSNNNSSNIDK